MIELQVTEDDDLFKTEEPAAVKDRRIVMEKTPERDSKLDIGKKEKSKESKKEKKGEKRKVEEDGKSPDEQRSASGSEDEKTKDKERNVKTRYVSLFIRAGLKGGMHLIFSMRCILYILSSSNFRRQKANHSSDKRLTLILGASLTLPSLFLKNCLRSLPGRRILINDAPCLGQGLHTTP